MKFGLEGRGLLERGLIERGPIRAFTVIRIEDHSFQKPVRSLEEQMDVGGFQWFFSEEKDFRRNLMSFLFLRRGFLLVSPVENLIILQANKTNFS